MTVAAIALASAAYAQSVLADDGTIKLGVLAPTSGGSAFVGLGLVDGIKLAVDEINANGGVNGKKIEYFVRDEQLRPDIAVAAAKELISAENVDILVGPATSGAALAVSEVAKAEQIPNFSPTSAAKAVTGEKLHRYIFQLSSTSDVDADRMIAILEKIGTKKLCYAGLDYAYTGELFGSMREKMPAHIEETNEYLVKLGNTDFNTLISQLMADPCDTIMSTIWGGSFIALAKQAAPFGLFANKKMVSGGNNGDYQTAAALKGDFPEGVWSHAHDLWYYNDIPELARYHEAIAKLQGREDPSMFAINGYISIKFIAAAIEKAGSTDKEAVTSALEGLTIDSPLGALTINDKTHRVGLPAFYGPIVTVEGSDVKRMSPAELLR